MKTLMSVAVVAAAGGIASADVFNDANDDIFDLGFQHLDILSVDVTNDSDWLYFSIQTDADLDATNWGKFGVGMNVGNGASEDNSNGWGRPIDWGMGISHWVGTWTDDGGSGMGGQVWSYDGIGWNEDDATYSAGTSIMGSDAGHAAGVQMVAVSLSYLGLGFGDVVLFDVVSSGGGDGDGGVDHLSRGDLAMGNWGDTSVAGNFAAYTIVPAPGAVAMLGLGGLAAARRRR